MGIDNMADTLFSLTLNNAISIILQKYDLVKKCEVNYHLLKPKFNID